MATHFEELEEGREAYIVRRRNPLARQYVIVSRVVLVGYPHLSDGAKLTYWVIYSHDWLEPARGRRKGYVYPTVGRLARLRHTTPRTIQRHLAELIGVRLVTRVIRKGRPSILYIEEPSEEEARRCQREERDGGDVAVTQGATILSPLQEDENKQRNSVNGIEESRMEEGRQRSKGMTAVGTLLAPKGLPKAQISRPRWLAEQMVSITGDPGSLGCYMAIAARCPEGIVLEALSLLKEARRDGRVRQSRGAFFVGIVRRLCKERGLADPFAMKEGRPA